MSTVAHGIVLRDVRTFSLEIDFLGGEIIIGYSDSVGGLLQFRSGVGGTQEEALGGGGTSSSTERYVTAKLVSKVATVWRRYVP